MLPPAAVRALEDAANTPEDGSWTARAAKFLRSETFLSADSLGRRHSRSGGTSNPAAEGKGDAGTESKLDPKQKPQQEAAPTRMRRRRGASSAQSPQRSPSIASGSADAAHERSDSPKAVGQTAPQSSGPGQKLPAADEGMSNGKAAASEAGADGGGAGPDAPKAEDLGGPASALRRLQVKVGGVARGQAGALKHWTPASWWHKQPGSSAWQEYEIRHDRLLPGSATLLVCLFLSSPCLPAPHPGAPAFPASLPSACLLRAALPACQARCCSWGIDWMQVVGRHLAWPLCRRYLT